MLIRENLEVFPTEIIIDLGEKVYDNSLSLIVGSIATYIVSKFKGKIQKTFFGKKEVLVNKDEIIDALLEEIKRLKESQNKQE